MPKYVLPIPRVFESVTRPLIKKATEEVCTQFNIPPECKIVFYGRAEGIPINNSTPDSRDNPLRLDTEHRINVEYEEEVVNPFEVTVLKPNQRLIFLDESLHVWMKPVFVGMKLTLNFEYIAPDKNSAAEWKQQAELNSYRMANQFNFDADFYYYIPEPASMQLTRLHTLRERSQVPLNESLSEWFKRCYSPNVTVLADSNGKRTRQAIAVKLLGLHAVSNMQHDIAPIEKDNPAGNWKSTFSITMWYDRPDDVVIVYPLMVHNQLIPKKYREDNPTSLVDRSNFEGNRSLHLSDLHAFETRRNTRLLERFISALKLPHFDDWIHTHQLAHHACMNTLLIGLMPTDPRWIFTFDNKYLGDYGLKDSAIKYMKTCKGNMLRPYDSLFHISLHSWSSLIDHQYLTIDEELKMSSVVDLDYKNMYHVVFTLLCDLTYLSDIGWEDLEKNPDFFEDYVDAVYPDSPLVNIPKGPDGTIDKELVKDKIKDSVDEGSATQHTVRPRTRFVNNFYIATAKKD